MILIRHGAPARSDVCYGHSDPALLAPAETTARALPEALVQRPGSWYCSPSPRCLALARALVTIDRLTVVEALRELNFGDWEQRSWSEIDRNALDTWALQPLDFKIPGGESARDLFNRVQAWAEQAGLDNDSVIVAHAGSLRALAATRLGQPFEQTWQWPVSYGTALVINARGSGFDRWQPL